MKENVVWSGQSYSSEKKNIGRFSYLTDSTNLPYFYYFGLFACFTSVLTGFYASGVITPLYFVSLEEPKLKYLTKIFFLNYSSLILTLQFFFFKIKLFFIVPTRPSLKDFFCGKVWINRILPASYAMFSKHYFT